MPVFGKKSTANLETCHNDIIAVCNEAILVTDFSVISGHRKPEDQFKLFQKGREYKNDKWVIKREDEIVTYKDGFEKKSIHNYDPSEAVDIVPYPVDWNDKNRFHFLAGVFLGIAYRMKIEGIIDSTFTWGGNWKNFKDYPHFQINKKKG